MNNNHHPTVAELRKELADLLREYRKLRADLRTRPSPQERIAQAFRDGWREASSPFQPG